MGAGSFPGVESGRDADHSPPSGVEVYKQSRAIPVLSLWTFVASKKEESYLQFLLETECGRNDYVNEKFQ
jgi:hypothetical protein